MAKKKQQKSGSKKKRKKQYRPEKDDDSTENASGGAMQGMVSGFRRAVGVETSKKQKTWLDHAWTLLLLLAVAGILFWKFGRG